LTGLPFEERVDFGFRDGQTAEGLISRRSPRLVNGGAYEEIDTGKLVEQVFEGVPIWVHLQRSRVVIGSHSVLRCQSCAKVSMDKISWCSEARSDR
jgi:hypothetical protein